MSRDGGGGKYGVLEGMGEGPRIGEGWGRIGGRVSDGEDAWGGVNGWEMSERKGKGVMGNNGG